MKNLKGSIILFFTALIWGVSFVAQTSATDEIGSFTFNFFRSVLGAFVLFIYVYIRFIRQSKSTSGENESVLDKHKLFTKKDLIAGVICGTVLFLAVNFQTFGIAVYPSEVAASGRSGFLTATYVIMVAIFSGFFGKRLNIKTYVAVVICMVGMGFLCLSKGVGGLYLGDLLGFICAIGFTAHILVIDRFNGIDGVKLSCIQMFTCGILSGISMLLFEEVDFALLKEATIPILYSGIMSCAVAYTLQIIGQKYTKPSVASIIMSLESVFAALGGWVILGEKLSALEILGCVLVFIAVILAQNSQANKSE